MKKILLTYAPQGGYTEQAAYEIAQSITFAQCNVMPGSKVSEKDFETYAFIIIGVATLGNDSWNSGKQDADTVHLQNIVNKTNFSNKTIALFGLGNAVLYPSHFVDEMGNFEQQLQEKHAKLVGYTSAKEYTFKDSKALRGEKICGLALDFDTELHTSKERIAKWTMQLENEL